MYEINHTTKDNRKALAIGNARVIKIAIQYEKLGYLVLTNTGNHEGPDLIIVSLPDGRIRKVIEVTNYARPNEYMADDRVSRYINCLEYFKSIKGIELELIVSYMENLTAKQLLEIEQFGIRVNAVGSQDLPEEKAVDGWIE